MTEQTVLEQQKIDELARRYSSQGYHVLVEPRGDQLPAFLKGFSPDLIAQRDTENLVIEVKRRLSSHDQSYWRALSDAVARQPGWKVQVVLMDLDDIEWRPPATLPKKSEVKARLREVATLVDRSQYAAALMLLWSVFEATARHHLAKRGVSPTERLPSIAIVKQLLAEGIIGDEDYRRLIPSLGDRNVLAHGFLQQNVSATSVGDLMQVTKQLTDRM